MEGWKWKLTFSSPIRPKARVLVQNDSPPGWLKESGQAGVFLYVMDGQYRLLFPYLTGCPDYWQEVPSCELMECPAAVIWELYITIRHGQRHARKAWPGILVDPCLPTVHASPMSELIAVVVLHGGWFYHLNPYNMTLLCASLLCGNNQRDRRGEGH